MSLKYLVVFLANQASQTNTRSVPNRLEERLSDTGRRPVVRAARSLFTSGDRITQDRGAILPIHHGRAHPSHRNAAVGPFPVAITQVRGLSYVVTPQGTEWNPQN